MLIETLVWTVIVEVTLIRAKHEAGVSSIVDHGPIGALASDTADEPFRIAVRARRLRWRLDDLNGLGLGLWTRYFYTSREKRSLSERIPVPLDGDSFVECARA